MKLPRDMDAPTLIKALKRLDYQVMRQTGSHIRLQSERPRPHVLTIPAHSPIKVGTLAAILADLAGQHQLTREELLRKLFD